MDLRNSEQLLKVVFSTFGGHKTDISKNLKTIVGSAQKIKAKKIDAWKKNYEF